jgi:ABC-type uncharacterized transport system substrate-binding protein
MLAPEPRGEHEAAGISRCPERSGCVARGGACAADDADHWFPWRTFAIDLCGEYCRDSSWITGSGLRGQNLAAEHRWAEGQYELLPALAADLVSRRVNVIVTLGGPPPALAAKAATSMIPVVFHMGADPVQLGIVASLGRPGGNITGATMLALALEAKRLALVREIAPTATLIGMLVNPRNAQTQTQVREVQEAAARITGLEMLFLNVSSERDVEIAFSELAEKRAGGLIIGSDAYVANMFAHNAALAARHRIPAIGGSGDFARAGG